MFLFSKVRQPVICINNHVFCSICIDLWLKNNSQCPACRVPITPENPCKEIIGKSLFYKHIEIDEKQSVNSVYLEEDQNRQLSMMLFCYIILDGLVIYIIHKWKNWGAQVSMRNLRASWNLHSGRGCACRPKY